MPPTDGDQYVIEERNSHFYLDLTMKVYYYIYAQFSFWKALDIEFHTLEKRKFSKEMI